MRLNKFTISKRFNLFCINQGQQSRGYERAASLHEQSNINKSAVTNGTMVNFSFSFFVLEGGGVSE